MALPFDIKEFTHNVRTDPPNNAVLGDGLFDTLMTTATKHLNHQYSENRITGEYYANAYVQIYQATLATATQMWLQKGIAEKQLELFEKQIEVEEAKKDLHQRQKEGFDEDFVIKTLKTLTESYSMLISVVPEAANSSNIPNIAKKTEIDNMYKSIVTTHLNKGGHSEYIPTY